MKALVPIYSAVVSFAHHLYSAVVSFAHHLYSAVLGFAHHRSAAIRERGERGQNTLEYLGLAIIIAIAVVVALNGAREPLRNLANNFVAQVRQILSATGGGG